MVEGKKILLGICGSIAAYKSILLIRLLVKAGAEVKVVITHSAKDFVTPLSLSTISKNEVLVDSSRNDVWNNHVQLGRWADIMLIAPLSCNTLAKMANGICDNLLLATYLSATCPVVVAPAMDEDMWLHPTTKVNVEKIQANGNAVIPVEKGELASGLYGDGRMAEPEQIISYMERNFFFNPVLKGRKALVTAGPTHEPFDPVRFIGNQSTGKMGAAIANELALRGAEVELILGPSSIEIKDPRIRVTRVQTAAEMYKACLDIFPSAQIAVMSAAVADYTPASFSDDKIKKNAETFNLELSRTKDILLALGKKKKPGQILVGFALENTHEEENARKKLKSKNADMIVLNSLNDAGAGFGYDTNQVTVFEKSGTVTPFGKKSKHQAARDIVDLIVKLL